MLRIFVSILAVSLWLSAQAKAEPRLALVIGGADPGGEIGNRSNADAHMISAALQRQGFAVTLAETPTLQHFNGKLAAFKTEVRAAGPDATCFFYYSGKAVHHLNSDTLLPGGENLKSEDERHVAGFGVETIASFLGTAGCGRVLLVLEIGRLDPWPSTMPMLMDVLEKKGNGVEKKKIGGPGEMQVYYAFATQEKTDRARTTAQASLFTTALVDAINAGQADLPSIFSQAQQTVMRATANAQQPQEISDFSVPFRLDGS